MTANLGERSKYFRLIHVFSRGRSELEKEEKRKNSLSIDTNPSSLPPSNTHHDNSFGRSRSTVAAETCKMHNQMQMEAGEGGHIGGNEAGVPKTVGGFSNESGMHRHRGM